MISARYCPRTSPAKSWIRWCRKLGKLPRQVFAAAPARVARRSSRPASAIQPSAAWRLRDSLQRRVDLVDGLPLASVVVDPRVVAAIAVELGPIGFQCHANFVERDRQTAWPSSTSSATGVSARGRVSATRISADQHPQFVDLAGSVRPPAAARWHGRSSCAPGCDRRTRRESRSTTASPRSPAAG